MCRVFPRTHTHTPINPRNGTHSKPKWLHLVKEQVFPGVTNRSRGDELPAWLRMTQKQLHPGSHPTRGDNSGKLHPWNSTQLAGLRDLLSAALLVRLLPRVVFSASISWRVALQNLASLRFSRQGTMFSSWASWPCPPPSTPPLFEEMFQFGENCCTRPHLFCLLCSFQPPLSQHSLQRGWHRCWNMAWRGWYWCWNMATHWATMPQQQSLALGNFNRG